MEETMKIGILGAGHLGASIINGLLNSKKYQKKILKLSLLVIAQSFVGKMSNFK